MKNEKLVEATMLALTGKLKNEGYRNGRYVENDPESEEALKNLRKSHPSDIIQLGGDGSDTFKYKDYFIELRPETTVDDNEGTLEMDFVVFENEDDMGTDYDLNICNDYADILHLAKYWSFVKKCIEDNVKNMKTRDAEKKKKKKAYDDALNKLINASGLSKDDVLQLVNAINANK